MRRASLLAIFCALVLQGCATERTASQVPTDHRACATNFSANGGSWSTEEFETFEDFSNTTHKIVFESVAASIAANGFKIVESNPETGFINAVKAADNTEAEAFFLKAAIADKGADIIRAELALSAPNDLGLSAESLRDEFCELLASISQNVVDSKTLASKPEPKPEVAPPPAPTKKKRHFRRRR